ncbi:hypothetical protein TRIP_C20541 [Candidatus Zixiibacteriota bacterium]|nr:hypothetical protein TRIP_C20541 [candidate division Zixibacteria bacterium]
MENLVGKITASLLENEPDRISELANLINSNIKPPEPIRADEVEIRAMYIVSDQVNSYGGCFPPDEHQSLINLLIDSPVLVGHRKDSLPIARNFHAEAVRRDGANWVKVYFYWRKDSEPGEELRKNIDSGIYKECSISFIFSFPECSICGADIRECRHRPGEIYEVDGTKREAYFNYREIEKVLETSLVYRGSVENTAITGELFMGGKDIGGDSESKIEDSRLKYHRIWSIDALDPAQRYMVMPAYESIPIRLIHKEQALSLQTAEKELESSRLQQFACRLNFPEGNYVLEGCLLGYRGKERQTPQEIESYLAGRKSAVHRMELKVIDIIEQDNQRVAELSGKERHARLHQILGEENRFLLPVEECGDADLGPATERLSTRFGTLIFSADSESRFFLPRRHLFPAVISDKEKCGSQYRYRVGCIKAGEELQIATMISSPMDIEAGQIVELEVAAFKIENDHIKVSEPRLVHFYHDMIRMQDISLLAAAGELSIEGYELLSKGEAAFLKISEGKGKESIYRLSNFSESSFLAGKRFLADAAALSETESSDKIISGKARIKKAGESFCLETGSSGEKLYLRRIVLHGKARFLLYRTGAEAGECSHE